MKKYHLSKRVQWSEVFGEISIIDIGTGMVYKLNETGKIMWKAILESSSDKEILERISNELLVDKDIIRQTLDGFKQKLIQKGLIIEESSR